jgi:hypothetical protein
MLRPMLRLGCAVLVLSLLMATSAAAQTMDKRTLFTFSSPVAVPGKTLPAGQYLFRLADPTTSGKVIQVLSADGTTPYGLFFSYLSERPEPSAQPEVRFMETAKGMPAAIKTWWYPGERIGYEFIYPKDQARRLAEGIAQPVLTTKAETTTTEQTNTLDLARMSSTGGETAVGAANATPSTPTGTMQEGTIASSELSIPNVTLPAATNASNTNTDRSQAVATSGTQTAAGGKEPRKRLPQTATNLPMLAAIGTLMLATGALMSAGRNRTTVDRRR